MDNYIKIDLVKLYKAVIVILICSLVFFLTSCEKNIEIVSEEIEIESFTSIDIKTSGLFNVENGVESKLIFKGDNDFYDILDVKVINGKLIIDTKEEIHKDFGKIEFFVSMPIIKNLEIEGSADVILNDFLLQEEDLSIDVEGQGDIKINNFEKVKKLDINISGSATIDALSNFENLDVLDIDITGSGLYNGYLLETNTCNVKFVGDGSCKVYVKNILNIGIVGNGEIYYKGNPEVRSSISGAGFILDQN